MIKTTLLSRSQNPMFYHCPRRRLRENKHVRYMWIPHADAVVVVACNPMPAFFSDPAKALASKKKAEETDALEPLISLLKEATATATAFEGKDEKDEKDEGALSKSAQGAVEVDETDAHLRSLGFSGLRDRLLQRAPLDAQFVARVNRAEAEFWRRSQGVTAVGPSDEILGFDCGGQQWVNEQAMPCGSVGRPDRRGVDYVLRALEIIEDEKETIAAPAPIEQRWTSGSRCPMNPASGTAAMAPPEGYW